MRKIAIVSLVSLSCPVTVLSAEETVVPGRVGASDVRFASPARPRESEVSLGAAKLAVVDQAALHKSFHHAQAEEFMSFQKSSVIARNELGLLQLSRSASGLEPLHYAFRAGHDKPKGRFHNQPETPRIAAVE